MTNTRSTFEIVSDAFEALTDQYFDIVRALPHPSSQVVLNTIWALYMNALLDAFNRHGWTEEEWEAELERRLLTKEVR